MNLDVTCSVRQMWRDRENENFIYLDVEPKVKPMVVGDLRRLPIRDKCISTVWFDPPFILGKGHPVPFFQDLEHTWYGLDVDSKYLWSLFVKGSQEFRRVLREGGLLFLKWKDEEIPLQSVLGLLVGFKVLMVIPYRSKLQRGKAQSYWVVLSPKSTP